MNGNDAELGLIVKLRALDRHFALPAGLTIPEQRKDLIRTALEPWLDTTFTVSNGKRITMAMQYAQAFGEVP